jgi:hypothetical protein
MTCVRVAPSSWRLALAGEVAWPNRMTTPAFPSYAGHRFPAEIISHAVWLYFRFPLSLRMVEEMLAARGIIVSHESVRQWALKFGQDFANRCTSRGAAILYGWGAGFGGDSGVDRRFVAV